MKRLRLLFVLDTFLLVALVILMVPRSGLALHEWLGLAVIPLVMVHLLYAWQWIAMAIPRLLALRAWRQRINVLLNVLLFVTFVVTVFSGIMTSVIALPSLDIPVARDENWLRLHNGWSNYFQLVAGLHLAMNWSWIAGTVRRLVMHRPTAQGDAAIAAIGGQMREP